MHERLAIAAGQLAEQLATGLEGGLAAPARSGHSEIASLARRAAADLVAEAGHVESRRQVAAAARWSRVRRLFALSPFETDLIAVASLPDEHELLATVVAALHPRSEPVATPALAAALLVRQGGERVHLRDALLGGTLAERGLVRLGGGPFFHCGLTLAPGLWAALHGYDTSLSSDTGARGCVEAVAPALGLAGWLERDEVRLAARMLAPTTGSRSTGAVVVIRGDDGADDGAARDALEAHGAAIVRAAGARPVRITGDLAQRDPRAAGIVISVRDEVPIVAAGDVTRELLDSVSGPLIAVGSPASHVETGDRPLLIVSVGPTPIGERVRLWQALLPGRPDLVDELASIHRVDAVRAGRAVADAVVRIELDGEDELGRDVLAATIRQRAAGRLPAGARLVTPRAGWADLVVDHDAQRILSAATDRARHQVRVLHEWGFGSGRAGETGVRLLFSGPPGTGKTLAAEVMASVLELDLLVVDLAALVSKWLGETEKNLAEVFDVAERTQALLFFDEADSLFARRTDVNDAHSRWANLETAYLLGRLERFDGIAVLATNLRANIDTAFVRRLEFVCEFHEPERGERELLWERHLSRAAPRRRRRCLRTGPAVPDHRWPDQERRDGRRLPGRSRRRGHRAAPPRHGHSP